jgi:hypothetical protein
MKSHEEKNMDITRTKKKGKQWTIKNKIKKIEKSNKTLSQNVKRGRKKLDKKAIKMNRRSTFWHMNYKLSLSPI